MSLVFAAITPHTPLLLPSIAKEKIQSLHQTQEALQRLEQELYTSRPQLIIVVSPHTSLYPDSFTINAHTHFTSSYDTFGDLTTKTEWTGCPDIAARITHHSKIEHMPVQAMSEEKLDHGASIPLEYLTKHLPDIKVLPIGFSGLDPKAHIRFGQLLKEVIMTSKMRIAIIASGDLSHCLSEEAPSGFHTSGPQFDDALCSALQQHDDATIITLDQTMVAQADECGYRSILVLLGVVQHMNYTFVQHSYEHPFGVGYLVGQCLF